MAITGQGFLRTIDQLRPSDAGGGDFIDWNRSYLWDIKFHNRNNHESKLVGKFSEWFPAVDVTEDISNLTTYSVDTAFVHGLMMPQHANARQLSITFLDDEVGTVLNWLRVWINTDIMNKGKYLTPLESCVKLVQLLKLNSQKKIVYSKNYWVIPMNLVQDTFDSESKTNTYTVLFHIAGQAQGDNL